MSTKLAVTSVMVLDQDEALDFYVNKLGLEVGQDIRQGPSDFTQGPTDHRYGTDMGVRDPFGNAIRILRPSMAAHEATA
jgi:catechol 2,3-dioxygenase-like lactoylglutathione lyase family enzyme